MDPYPGVSGLHGEEVFVVEAVLPLTLTGKVQLGMLSVLSLCGGAGCHGISWQGVLPINALQDAQKYNTKSHVTIAGILVVVGSLTFNTTANRQRQLDEHLLHVCLDLVQVLLTEVLHCVPHGKRLKHADPLPKIYIVKQRYICMTEGYRTGCIQRDM